MHRIVAQVGDAVSDLLGCGAFTEGGQAFAAERVGSAPGAGGIEDGAGEQSGFGAVAVAHVHRQWFGVAAGVDDAVAAAAGDADDLVIEADRVTESIRQWGQVLPGPGLAGGVRVVVGGLPAGGVEEAAGGGVDQFGPAGEGADTAPLRHCGSGNVAAFEHQRFEAAFAQVGGGGQADRSGPYDDDGQLAHDRILSSTGIDLSCCQSIDGRRCMQQSMPIDIVGV